LPRQGRFPAASVSKYGYSPHGVPTRLKAFVGGPQRVVRVAPINAEHIGVGRMNFMYPEAEA
jgi:hypothetical protein